MYLTDVQRKSYMKPQDLEVVIYEMVNKHSTSAKPFEADLDPIGVVEEFTSFIWNKSYNKFGEFEINAPYTKRNADLFKQGNFVYKKGDAIIAMIDNIEIDLTEEGVRNFKIRGKTVEIVLDRRVAFQGWGEFYNEKDHVSNIMYHLFYNAFSTGAGVRGLYPFLNYQEQGQNIGDIVQFQGDGSVYNCVNKLAEENDIGFNIHLYNADNPIQKRSDGTLLLFHIYQGIDRTEDQTSNDAVILSLDFEDILTSTYINNTESTYNVGWVRGTNEAGFDFNTEIGDLSLSGWDRKEAYIDGSSVETTGLNNAEYMAALQKYAQGEMLDAKKVETFECKIKTFGNLQYRYGEDYFLGDKITIYDNFLDLKINARITAVEEDFSDTYNLILTFGYDSRSLKRKIKSKIK